MRQGYDTNSWRTISGAPSVVGGRLSIDNEAGVAGSAIHYADFVKGDISFDVNVPVAPVEGTYRIFGVSTPDATAYIRFAIGSELQCEVREGDATYTVEVAWDDAWTAEDTIFRIHWEAGWARFYIHGVHVCTIDSSADFALATYDVQSIPYGPLSLYLYDSADIDSMTIGNISVRGMHSYILNPKTSDATPVNPSGLLSLHEHVTITENFSSLLPELVIPYTSGEMKDNVTVSESITLLIPELFIDKSDSVTITETVNSFITQQFIGLIYDEVTVTEEITKGIIG